MSTLNHILDLPTPRLLAYYKKHYRGGNPWEGYWGEIEDNQREYHAKWEMERDAIKAELDTREHVE